jgi:hypothetical protein
MPCPENVLPHRIKKGQILNPYGRPKGSVSLTFLLKKALEKKIEMTEKNGVKTSKEAREIIMLNLVNQACRGNLCATNMIFDRVEGRPKNHEPDNDTNKGTILEALDTMIDNPVTKRTLPPTKKVVQDE